MMRESTRGLRSWRLALRIARRSAVRTKARAIFTSLLLALPVCAGATLLLVWDASYASADREASWQLGQADLRLDGPTASRIEDQLPAGSGITPYTTGIAVVEVGENFRTVQFEGARADDPVHRGRYVVRDGRIATQPGEVTLSETLVAATGIAQGQSITLAGSAPRSLTVVGIVDTAHQLSRQVMVLSPADPLAARGTSHLLVDLPGRRPQWQAPAVDGLSFTDRASVAPTAAEQAMRIAGLVVVAGFAAVQVGLLAGSVFSVSARRRRREMAMLSAVGATPTQVSRVLLADGAMLGVIGGICGVGVALVTFALARDTLERVVNHPLHAGAPPAVPLALLVVGAFGFGLLSSLVPALGVARMQVRAALAGREAATRKHAIRLSGAAGLLTCLGVIIVVYAVRSSVSSAEMAALGAGFILLGPAASGPAVVGLASRVATLLSFTSRVAIRHCDRHRLRTGAAVAAICAAVAGSTALVVFFAADTRTGAARQSNARPGQILIPADGASTMTADDQTALRQCLPIRTITPIVTVPATAGYFLQDDTDEPPPNLTSTVAVGGPDLIEVVTGRAPSAEALAALDRGEAVVFYQAFSRNGHAVLTVDNRQVELPVTLLVTDDYYQKLPSLVISSQTARRLQLTEAMAGMVIDTVRTPTANEIAAAQSVVLGAQARAEGAALEAPAVLLLATKPGTDQTTDPLLYVLAIVSGLVTVVASAVVIGLSRAEMRTDIATLAAIGAGPHVIRLIGAIQAAFIVGLGAVIGTVAGIAPAAGLMALRPDLTWHMAWGPLICIVIGSPVLALTVVAALPQPRLVLTRRLE